MSINEVTEKVRKFLIEEFEIEEDKIFPDANLKSDIGIDSLDFADIAVFIEDIFGYRVNTDELRKIGTFKEFCEFIHSKVN